MNFEGSNMKKMLSLILALCMCLISITGCSSEREDSNHTHSFETSWSYNEEYHWHVCEVNNCDKVADKEAHNWIRHTDLDIKATEDEKRFIFSSAFFFAMLGYSFS